MEARHRIASCSGSVWHFLGRCHLAASLPTAKICCGCFPKTQVGRPSPMQPATGHRTARLVKPEKLPLRLAGRRATRSIPVTSTVHCHCQLQAPSRWCISEHPAPRIQARVSPRKFKTRRPPPLEILTPPSRPPFAPLCLCFFSAPAPALAVARRQSGPDPSLSVMY